MRCVSYTRTVSCMENGEIPKDIIGQQNQRIQDYIKKKRMDTRKKNIQTVKRMYMKKQHIFK